MSQMFQLEELRDVKTIREVKKLNCNHEQVMKNSYKDLEANIDSDSVPVFGYPLLNYTPDLEDIPETEFASKKEKHQRQPSPWRILSKRIIERGKKS